MLLAKSDLREPRVAPSIPGERPRGSTLSRIRHCGQALDRRPISH